MAKDVTTRILLTAKDDTKEAFSSVERGLGGMSSSLLNMQGILAGVSVGAIGAMVKSSIDLADSVSKASQKFGISTEELSKLKYAAELADVSFESLQIGLKKLSVTAVDAASGSAGASKGFDLLGISVKDSDGKLKSNTALLEEVADKFAVMRDGVEKTAISIKLFGKSGQDMIPFLNGSAAAIRDAGAELESFGGVISTQAGLEAERFNDNLDRMKAMAGGTAATLKDALLPTLNVIGDAFIEAGKDGSTFSFVSEGIKVGLQTVAVLGSDVAFVLKGIGIEIGGVAAQAALFLSGDFSGAGAIGDHMKKDAAERRKELDDLQKRILNPPPPPAIKKREGAAPEIINDEAGKANAKKEAAEEAHTQRLLAALQKRFQSLAEVAQDAGKNEEQLAELKKARALESLKAQHDEIVASLKKRNMTFLDEEIDYEQARKNIEFAFETERAERAAKIDKQRADEAEKNSLTLNDGVMARMAALRDTAETEYLTDLERAERKQAKQLELLEADRLAVMESNALKVGDRALSDEQEIAFDNAKRDIFISNANAIAAASVESDHQIVEGKKRYNKMSLDSMGSFFGMAKGLMNSHSRAAFEVGKAAAISETVINTYKSATASYAAMAGIPVVGPALGAIAAAGAIAAGLAQVSAIRSTSFGGAGAGGGSFGGASSTLSGGNATPDFPVSQAPSAPPAGVIVSVNIGDAGIFSASAVRGLIEQINEQVRLGATIDQIRVN